MTRLALATGADDKEYISNDFPFKDVQIKLRGTKVSGSPRRAIMLHHSSLVARDFFHKKKIVNQYDFNLIWWDGVEQEM